MARWLALLILIATTASAQNIRVTPEDSLADTSAHIVVEGLVPKQPAIIRASTTDSDRTSWQSWAGFVADKNGAINVALQAPRHGTYTGVDPMGLFWSMEVAGEAHGKRRFNTAGLQTLTVHLEVQVEGKTVGTAIAKRRFIASDVSRVDVKDNRLIGTLFKPRSPIRGAILVIGGSEGGIGDEVVAALLASHGYLTLAIAYFGVPPLSEMLSEVPLETFFGGLDYLQHQPEMNGKKISIIGTSKGAEAALLVATLRSDVAAVAAFAPSSVVWSCICNEQKSSWSVNGQPIPFVPPGRDPTYAPPPEFPLEPAVHYRYRLRTAPRGTGISGTRIAAKLMLIAGDDDRLWPSAEMARQLANDRRNHTSDVLLILPGAGHLISKTYVPAGSTRIGNGRIETGGSASANAHATSILWSALLKFLKKAAS
jgi:dienelactone hydrolase